MLIKVLKNIFIEEIKNLIENMNYGKRINNMLKLRWLIRKLKKISKQILRIQEENFKRWKMKKDLEQLLKEEDLREMKRNLIRDFKNFKSKKKELRSYKVKKVLLY